MPHYMIFNSIQAGNRLNWSNIVGVFEAPSVDLACRAAARRQGAVGTYFAIEGHPWGIAMEKVEGVSELGGEKSWAELERERQELELQLLRDRASGRGRRALPTAEENDRAFDAVSADLDELEGDGQADDAIRRGQVRELEHDDRYEDE